MQLFGLSLSEKVTLLFSDQCLPHSRVEDKLWGTLECSGEELYFPLNIYMVVVHGYQIDHWQLGAVQSPDRMHLRDGPKSILRSDSELSCLHFL